jgi:hypothetical protein
MLISADLMRALLLLCVLGMAVLAGVFISRRPLSTVQVLTYGALILLLPLVGPFLVIMLQPGGPRRPRARRRRPRMDMA